jgi:zinc transporter
MSDARATHGLELPGFDRRGLVCGYELAESKPLRLDRLGECGESPLWLHFNLADGRARKWLTEQAELPAEALELLLEAHPRVRVTLVPGGVAAILHDLHHDFHDDPEQFGELRFYVDERRVISARRAPLRSVDRLRRELDAGLSLNSTVAWLERLVRDLTEAFAEVARGLSDRVDELEDEVVSGRGHERRVTLAQMRRLLVRFRRHVNSDRSALGRLRSFHHGAAEELSTLRRSIEQLDGVAQDVELVHERVRVLQEEVSSLLAEATNRNLYVLSIVTTVLLPATLVTGIWGMNVGGVPWADDSRGFFFTGLVLLGSVLLSLLLLRRTRVL